MPKTKISEFSATANSNTDINSINIAEGCAPSNINDAIRELMAELKDFQAGTKGDSFNGPVGTSTAAAGAFTTLSSTGNTTLGDASGDTVTINGTTTFVNVNPTLSAGTANGVLYLNGSKVATSGSALTFDGTNLGIGNTSPSSYNGAADNLVIGSSGSNGMTIVSGTANAGYIMFADGTTGQQAYEGQITYDHSVNQMWFNVNAAEAMRLTSTGLGIGTSSPAFKLDVASTAGTVANFDSTNANGTGLRFTRSGTANGYVGSAKYIVGGALADFGIDVSGANNLIFGTNDVERARIDSSGRMGLGTDSPDSNYYLTVGITSSDTYAAARFNRGTTSSTTSIAFANPNGVVGTVSTSGTSTAYNTSSDYRLKHDIAPMTGALAKVAALKPVTYKWNTDNSNGEGFIAHELAEVVPQAVTGAKDAVDADGNPVYQGIDTSFLVATLTAAIKEAVAEINSLKARLDAANL